MKYRKEFKKICAKVRIKKMILSATPKRSMYRKDLKGKKGNLFLGTNFLNRFKIDLKKLKIYFCK